MSNLDFNMVGLSPVAFSSLSSSLSPFDEETFAPEFSKRLEKLAKDENPKQMIRDLADLVLPGRSAKLLYPRLATMLGLTERRVRSIYNGEVSRLWDDERMELRKQLTMAKNAKERSDFHAALVSIQRGLSAAGVPLSADQTRAINQMVGASA